MLYIDVQYICAKHNLIVVQLLEFSKILAMYCWQNKKNETENKFRKDDIMMNFFQFKSLPQYCNSCHCAPQIDLFAQGLLQLIGMLVLTLSLRLGSGEGKRCSLGSITHKFLLASIAWWQSTLSPQFSLENQKGSSQDHWCLSSLSEDNIGRILIVLCFSLWEKRPHF